MERIRSAVGKDRTTLEMEAEIVNSVADLIRIRIRIQVVFTIKIQLGLWG
jgi:hypothetical protein